jgi:hypothetical protein
VCRTGASHGDTYLVTVHEGDALATCVARDPVRQIHADDRPIDDLLATRVADPVAVGRIERVAVEAVILAPERPHRRGVEVEYPRLQLPVSMAATTRTRTSSASRTCL